MIDIPDHHKLAQNSHEDIICILDREQSSNDIGVIYYNGQHSSGMTCLLRISSHWGGREESEGTGTGHW